jgi:ribose transport system permease protein
VAVGVVTLALVLSLTTSAWASGDNFVVVARAAAITIVVGLSQMVVLAAGGLNLAVGATGGLVSTVAGSLMNSYGIDPILAVVGAIAVGTISGALIGLVIAQGGYSPFIATLAALSILTGIALGLTGSVPFYNLPDDFGAFGRASILGVPVIFIVAILLALVLGLVFRYTSYGRQVLAFGANSRAAELNGVPIKRLQISVYALSGFLASCAAILLIARLGNADPAVGEDWLLISFAAPIIGGARLAGGSVSVLGTVLAALLLAMLANGLVHWKVDVFFVQLFSGLIILAAAGIERVRELNSEATGRRERRRT